MSKKEFLNRLERMRNRSSVASTSATVAALTSDDIAEGTTNLYYTETRFDASFANKDTDDLAEGSTNFYYTEARFDTSFAAKDTDGLSEGSTNFYYTEARFDSSLSGKDTGDLAEGSNLYFTDERAQDAVGGMVDSTLTYDDGTPSLGVADGGVDTTQLADDAVDADKIDGADATDIRALLSVVEILSADRTYYVDGGSGSDSNDGLSSGAGAFATIQKAVDVASGLILSGNVVTIDVANGTYSENILLSSCSGKIVIEGDTTTPQNVIISGGASTCITSSGNVLGQWHIQGIELNGTGNGFDCNGGALVFNNMDFGVSGTQMFVRNDGACSIDTTAGSRAYEISAAGSLHVNCFGAFVNISSTTIDGQSGAFAFSTFVNAALVSRLLASGITFNNVASFTGKRYNAGANSAILTGGGGASYFPGDVAGTTATGGQYV